MILTNGEHIEIPVHDFVAARRSAEGLRRPKRGYEIVGRVVDFVAAPFRVRMLEFSPRRLKPAATKDGNWFSSRRLKPAVAEWWMRRRFCSRTL